ncbi:MAG TPA: RNA methyltransferase [Alphaproteobacteria bacterium]|nr:RNA methyltransferase [Alphaproteobacteria bacterium]
MLKIDSKANAHFKRAESLTTSKGLKKEGLFLLSGEKLVREFLKSPDLDLIAEIVPPKGKPVSRAKDVFQFASALFDEVDVLGTGSNILVLKQPKMEAIKDIDAHKPRGIEAVIPVGDPGNLGALLRSCEAFGVPRVILTQEAAHPFLPKSVKASAGSVLRLPILRGPALKEFPDNCIALDAKGEPLKKFKWPQDGMLVVGEEGQGLGSKPFKRRISIPTENVESLNAVVASSIALAHKAGVF